MTDSDGNETAEAALNIAKRNAQRVTELEDENEELSQEVARLQNQLREVRKDLAEVQLAVEDERDEKEYQQFDRDEKIRYLRERAYAWARNRDGRAALDYKDVRDGVFDGEPSAGHVYNLMGWAADHDGFKHDDQDGHRLLVKTSGVEDAIFTGEQNDPEGVETR